MVPTADNEGIDEDTIVGIWTTIMIQLCNRHRTQARNVRPTTDNPRPTDWKIEDLRAKYYRAYPDPAYFRIHITELANRHPEIEVEGNIIRLTTQGLDYCEKNVSGWQRDFVEIPRSDVESFTKRTIKKNKALFERLAKA